MFVSISKYIIYSAVQLQVQLQLQLQLLYQVMNVQAPRQKIVSKEPVQIHQSQFAVARVLPRLLMHLHAKRMLLAVEVNNVLFQKSFPRLEQKKSYT